MNGPRISDSVTKTQNNPQASQRSLSNQLKLALINGPQIYVAIARFLILGTPRNWNERRRETRDLFSDFVLLINVYGRIEAIVGGIAIKVLISAMGREK